MKLDDLILDGTTVYLPKHKTNVFSDLHIGLEGTMTDKGMMMHGFFNDQLKKIKSILSTYECDQVILNGDIKHKFGEISEIEWSQLRRLFDLLKGKKVIIIKGNHDNMILPIGKKKGIAVKNFMIIGHILICHGDKIIETKRKYDKIIIGHEHPSIKLQNKSRIEQYKCFLAGKWKDKKLIVMPSSTFASYGNDVLHEKPLSPYLKNIDDFKIYICHDKIYDFGKIKDLKKI